MIRRNDKNKPFTSMKQLPDSEKPYEKFMNQGVEALSDAELLAVIMRSGTQGRRVIEVAQDLLSVEEKSLLNLYALSFEDMLQIRGIGPVKAIQLKGIAELSKRISKLKYQTCICLDHPRTIANYYMERLRHEKQEHLLVLFFDAKCQLLKESVLSIGSITATFVSTREIFLAALRCNAVQIVLLHNHPSGNVTPSKEDDVATKRVFECGQLLEIPVIDHIIIGDCTYYSYKEHKRILY